MTIKRLTTVLAMTAALMFGVSTAHAKKPLDVDCNVLEQTLIVVDAGLPADSFDSLGDLVSQAKKNEPLFDMLRGAIFVISDSLFMSPILFTDPKEVVPTIAKCGLTPLLVRLVSD